MMSKQTILTIFFSVSINQANNFEKIALVVYNNKEYKRVNPNELVIVNDSLRIFKGILRVEKHLNNSTLTI